MRVRLLVLELLLPQLGTKSFGLAIRFLASGRRGELLLHPGGAQHLRTYDSVSQPGAGLARVMRDGCMAVAGWVRDGCVMDAWQVPRLVSARRV